MPGLKVEIDTVLPSLGFKDALLRLGPGGKFDAALLREIPYRDLHLCCTGAAGKAACSPRLVWQEKERRLARFAALPDEELAESEGWLRMEGMLGDVLAQHAAKASPSWDALKPRHRLLAKLLCIYNHIDSPGERLQDAMTLAREASLDGVPVTLCSGLLSALHQLSLMPTDGSEFRAGVWKCMETLLDALPKEEQAALLRERISGYSCSSDCFRIA